MDKYIVIVKLCWVSMVRIWIEIEFDIGGGKLSLTTAAGLPIASLLFCPVSKYKKNLLLVGIYGHFC